MSPAMAISMRRMVSTGCGSRLIGTRDLLHNWRRAKLSRLQSQITVAMITRNEEKAVGKVIGDIRAAVPGAEILIVDSSSDRTADIAQSLGARVIRQFPPRIWPSHGYCIALR